MKMESNQPPDHHSVSTSPAISVQPNNGGHISLSSPDNSYSSPLHNSAGHISLSPPAGSPGSSPPRSSLASEHTHGSSPEKVSQEEVVVRKDVFKEPVDDRVVVEEPVAVVNKAVLEEPKAAAGLKTQSAGVVGGGGGSGRRRVRPTLSILRRAERERMVRKAAFGFRVFGFLFCLVSFGVMAADRNRGWALDSFDRYKEFRYCLSVNVIGFMYSGAQAFDLMYYLATGKYIVHHQRQILRYYFDFAFDQIIAYLLISASSSAAIRINDWQLNWGTDRFPDMATASISMSFLAFVALASSSLLSGYALCTSKST